MPLLGGLPEYCGNYCEISLPPLGLGGLCPGWRGEYCTMLCCQAAALQTADGRLPLSPSARRTTLNSKMEFISLSCGKHFLNHRPNVV